MMKSIQFGLASMLSCLNVMQMLALFCGCLMAAFVTLLDAPVSKLRTCLLRFVVGGFALAAAGYGFAPDDVMPQSYFDDLGVVIGGVAAIVAAIDASHRESIDE